MNMQHVVYNDKLYLAELIKNYEDYGSTSFNRAYALFSYDKLVELSEKGWISEEDFNSALSYSNLEVRTTTLPFKDFPSDIPPIQIKTRFQKKIEVAKPVEKIVWNFDATE